MDSYTAPELLSHSTSTKEKQDSKYNRKGLKSWDKDREIIYHLLSRTKRTARGDQYNLLPITSGLEKWKTKSKLKHLHPSSILFYLLPPTPFYLLPPHWSRGMKVVLSP